METALYREAMRYIRCNLPKRQKEEFLNGKIYVYFQGRPEFIFYLKDFGDIKAGECRRDNVGLGYRKDEAYRNFTNYNYESARQFDLRNAGVELSPSY